MKQHTQGLERGSNSLKQKEGMTRLERGKRGLDVWF